MRRVCKHTTKRNKKSVDNDHIYSLCFVCSSLSLFRNFHFAFSALFRCIFCLFGEYEPIECTCIFTRRWTGTFRTAMLYWSIWFGFVCMRMDYYHCAFEAHSQHFDEVENLFVPSHWWNRKCACSQNREHFSVVFSAAFCLILLPIFCDKMWLILPNQPNRLFLFFSLLNGISTKFILQTGRWFWISQILWLVFVQLNLHRHWWTMKDEIYLHYWYKTSKANGGN